MRIKQIQEAVDILTGIDPCLETEQVRLEDAYGRVAAESLEARIPIPPFRRSAFDGYALRSEDTVNASEDAPVVLEILETIAAGMKGRFCVTDGKAVKVMTGAAVPEGADTVIKYEDTCFTERTVSIGRQLKQENIIAVGEDVEKGHMLVPEGKALGPSEIAMLAGQGMTKVSVYKKPKTAIISSGSELLYAGQEQEFGKVYNTNPYLLQGYMIKNGIVPVDYGIIPDDKKDLGQMIEQALAECDMVITTGGVSKGDFDFIPDVLRQMEAAILFHWIDMKPGGAMIAAQKNGKVILGLSGSPGAAAVGLLRVGLPYMRKLCGLKNVELKKIKAVLKEPFLKKSKGTRILRGVLEIDTGTVVFKAIDNQRNGSVSSMLDCNALGEIPPGSGALREGTEITAYLI